MSLFFGILFCLFLAFIWIEYFRRIDIFEFERKHMLMAVFFMGILSAFLLETLQLYLPRQEVFRISGNLLNDFFYCFFAVGLVEELFKFLPFLVILFFFKRYLNETVDYIVYAAIAAIGFSCFENVLYFIDHGFKIITIRSVTSLPSHIFNSVMFVYGLMVYRFRPSRRDKLIVASYMFFGILSHSIYDFFLLGEIRFGFIWMLFYYLLLISIFVTMLGNALNNSEHYSPKKFIDSRRLTEFMLLMYTILWGLSSIFYIATAGDTVEVVKYLAAMIWKDSFLILVLVFRITRFKIIPGRWNRIRLELPFSLQFRAVFTGPPTPHNLNHYITPNFVRIRIKGESYNETYLNYFFDKNIVVQPVSSRKSFLKQRYKGVLDLKLFLKEDEVFYVLILFSESGTEYFYIKSKAHGRQRFGKYPIVALLKGPPLAEINEHHDIGDFKFLEWVVLKTVN